MNRDPQNTSDANATDLRLLWLAIVLLGTVFFFVGHDVQVSCFEGFAPWSDSDGSLESGGNAAKGLALSLIGIFGLYLILRRDGRPLRWTGWVTVHRGLSQFSRREGRCLGKSLDRRENGTVPLAPREGDRSMFSANRLPAKCVFRPKNGPVPSQLDACTGWLPAAIGFYVAWSAASILWSSDPGLSCRKLAVLMFCVFGALGFARQFRPRDIVLIAVAVPAAFLAVGIAAELALGTFRPWSEGYRFSGTIHPNTQGAHLTVLCLASFCLARFSRRGETRLQPLFWMLFASNSLAV